MAKMHFLMKLRHWAVLALVTAACSGGDSGTAPPVPSRLGIVTEPTASAASGVPLAVQPVVQVLDATGGALASRGVLVTASLASGGGTLSGATGIRTDADGMAVFTDLALRGPVGPRTLRFSATGLSAAISREIVLEAGPAASAVLTAGNNQTAPAGTIVPVAPTVRVADQSDNPVAGVAVTFTVTQGGGSVSGASAVTNAQGVATVGQWTLGTAVGANTLSVTVQGVPQPLVVAATGVVGPPALVTVVEGDGQTAPIGAAVPVAPAVKVTDAAGNVVAGVAIAFTPAAGSGTMVSGSPVTDGNGVARVGQWLLGLTPGTNTLSAGRLGAQPATFTATAFDFPVSAIAAGGFHSCGLTPAGLRCWGDNTTGQFGNGTLAPDSLPTPAGSAQVFTQITTGLGHTCGLTAAGTAWCWGTNTSGQLGDGTGQSRASPVQVSGGLSYRQISAGAAHTCAIRLDGAAYCWGSGANGRLGSGGTTTSPIPVPVAGGFTWLAVSAGGLHSCAVRNDGALYCWGANGSGRLGDGTTVDRPTPTAVTGGGTWNTVAAGGLHSCAVNVAGSAFCWGSGATGQLGGGTAPAQVLLPAAVSGGFTFAALAAGTAHTCGIATTGAAYCWGNNGSGKLGDGTGAQRNVPTLVKGGQTYTAIVPGADHTCAVSTAGSAICWGWNADGQLGDGSTTVRPSPVGVKQP